MPSHGLTRVRSGASRTTGFARFAVAAALVGAALGAPAAASAAPADAGHRSGVAAPLAPSAAAAPRLEAATVLQVNLCNSGADKECYAQGKSVKATAELVREIEPQILTLNEACSKDVDALFEVMRRVNSGTMVHWSFSPIHYANGHHIMCANGGHYGSAVIDSLDGMSHYNSWAYTFKDQARGDERRLANCSMVNTKDNAGYFTCAVQMTERDKATATAQCKQLVESIMDQVAGKSDMPILSAGTFNIRATGKDSIATCMEDVADDYTTAGQGVQHVVASTGITLGQVTTHELEGTKVPAAAFEIDFDGEGRR
ncbi:hypothetical protein GCM10010124_09720 [Pilimelia terevasa]|uniref:Endonuclease/exonuclease/phosphatase family protein n=1 Tax=Pilimelia terevasa TaxID=53372 RepID=A0A8J3BG96_9ACTN|nr:hypothetical protein [Pilimelia terevasa]GGK19219.1 hypothetical protein GCM10010124_09720 [Pilimelia terevasa]